VGGVKSSDCTLFASCEAIIAFEDPPSQISGMSDLDLSAVGPAFSEGEVWGEIISYAQGKYVAVRVVMPSPQDARRIAIRLAPRMVGPLVMIPPPPSLPRFLRRISTLSAGICQMVSFLVRLGSRHSFLSSLLYMIINHDVKEKLQTTRCKKISSLIRMCAHVI